jgi:hypothetical protein
VYVFGSFVKDQTAIAVWVYFTIFYSVPLVFESGFFFNLLFKISFFSLSFSTVSCCLLKVTFSFAFSCYLCFYVGIYASEAEFLVGGFNHYIFLVKDFSKI